MTDIDAAAIRRVAAEAALAVPGVVELQPDLRQSLAGAAVQALRALGSPVAPAEPFSHAGIHTELFSRTAAWHIEARCVVHRDRRVADTAREVHDAVQGAVRSQLTRGGTAGPVTVVVTVTRIDAHHPSALPGAA